MSQFSMVLDYASFIGLLLALSVGAKFWLEVIRCSVSPRTCRLTKILEGLLHTAAIVLTFGAGLALVSLILFLF